MKRLLPALAMLTLLFTQMAYAEDIEIEEYTLEGSEQLEELDVKPEKTNKKIKNEKVEEVDTSQVDEIEVKVDEIEVKVDKTIKIAPAFMKYPREGTFRAGIVGPGIYAGNKSIDAMMGIGAEGEYFFFENLSAGMRIQVATDFKSNNEINSVLSFVPQARYVFDLDDHPRWSFYVQAGVGIALLDGDNVAADIAIPGGGFWWQYNHSFSIGFDASLHILARSSTAISFFAGPSFRYQF